MKFTKKLSKKDYQKITFKLTFGIIGTILVFTFWLYGLLNLNIHYNSDSGQTDSSFFNNYYNSNGEVYTGHYLSFFTTQSNLLCCFFLVFAGFYHTKEGKWIILKNNIILNVCVYITITGLIFNGLLLPKAISDGSISAFNWFQLMWEHSVIPIVFIIYFLCVYNGRVYVDYKKHYKKNIWFAIIYPVTYLFYSLIRSYLVLYKLDQNGITYKDKKYFNYFFLNVNETTFGIPGYAWLVITLIIILGIIFLATFIYLSISNYKIKKLSVQESKVGFNS